MRPEKENETALDPHETAHPHPHSSHAHTISRLE